MPTAAIHQPNYLPGLTYFAKMAAADVFVLLDTVQYTKNNWTNRNRVKTASGATWLTVPVLTSHQAHQKVLDARIDTKSGWGRRHRQTLEQAYASAPFLADYAPGLFRLLGNPSDHIAELNIGFLDLCKQWLGLGIPFVRACELEVSGKGSELLVQICQAVGADRYLSGPGGRKYIQPEVFARESIKVEFHEYQHPTYRQLHGDFISHLSVCDLLFNEGPDSMAIIRSGMLDG